MELIKVDSISKKYGKKEVLKSISFSCGAGECIGIIGPNGCGKSTLLKILQGSLKPASGSLSYNGCNPLASPKYFSEYIGYVPQDNPLFANLSVLDNLKLWYCDSTHNLKDDIESGIIAEFKINTYLKEKVKNLSGGMKKRLSIACAIAKDPQILIMDEPGASLDIIAKNDIVNYIKKYISQGGTVIISSHEECELAVCTRTYLINNGVLELLDGTPDMSYIAERMKNL